MLRAPRNQLVMLLAVVALQNVAYTILIPLVPELRTRFNMSVLAVGAAFACFTAAKAFAQPLGGWLSDRYPARVVAAGGLLVAALATLALGLATSTNQVLIARLVWGLGEGLTMPALFMLVIRLGRDSGKGQARAIGWFGSAAVSGMALGPLIIAPLISVVRFEGAFALGGFLTAFGAGLLGFVRPVSGAEEETIDSEPAPKGLQKSYSEGWRLVLGLGVLDLLNNLIYAGIEPALPLVAVEHFDASARTVSILLSAGLVVFAAAAPIAGMVMGRWRPLSVAVVVLAAQAWCLCLPAVGQFAPLYAACFIPLMAAQSFTYVCVRAALAELSGAKRGRAIGSFGLISDLGWVLGPLLATALYGQIGTTVFPVLGAAAVLAIAMSAKLAITKNPKQVPSCSDR